MTKLTTLLVALCLTLAATAQKNFEVMTQKPTPGAVITIEYMPRNTVLQGVKDFEATAYLLEGHLPLAKAITLKQEGGLFRGTVKTNDTTLAVFFSFAKEEKQDNNSDEGYYTPLYDKKGNERTGANMALATGFSSYGGIWGLRRNAEKAAAFNKKEFANPAAREKFRNEYLTYLSQSKEETDKELLKAELARQLERKDLSEADMQKAKSLYETALKDKEKGEAILVQLRERFPSGAWKRNELVNAFLKEKNLAEKEKRFAEVVTAFGPVGKDEQQTLDALAGQLARRYADSGNYEAAQRFLPLVKSNATKASILNSIAWKLAGEGISKKPVDVKKGLELSQQSLAEINEEKKTLSAKPSFRTEAQYRRSLDYTYYTLSDTYATLLYHNGDYAKAYDIEKKAVEGNNRENAAMNEAFSLLTEKVKGAKEAQAELEKFLEEGSYTPAMKEQLKNIFLAGGKSEAQWTAYKNELEERAYNKLKAELAGTMINLPAPQFALKDLNGEKVELSSLKGKIVVVDFWATWCGPCIASFPGMQKTVDKFKNNPDVVFLFIDSWENGEDRQQKVTDFIAKNKYSFRVLYDETKPKADDGFVVIEQYKVDGIPTKFVIDRNSNIRFKAVGYSGSTDALVQELTAMIDMAAAESGEPLKKAF